MNKQYVFTAPDIEKCNRFGIKFEGLCQRISLWNIRWGWKDRFILIWAFEISWQKEK